MQVFQLAVLLASLSSVLGRGLDHIGKRTNNYVDVQERFRELNAAFKHDSNTLQPRAEPKHLNDKTKKFYVDGSKIPEVDFDIGESYAGLLPISSDPNEERQLYFWYFPSSNPEGANETTIWLNGGPGCSSLEGFIQENGPFLWQYGTYKPVPNPWTWQNLTNMLWVEQPVGTGFSQGKPNITTQGELAEQFKGFFRNFVDTFSAQNRKVYITGESYAGQYVPNIASSMLDEKDKEYFDVEGILIYDPSISTDAITEEAPAVAFVDYWKGLFPFNSSFVEELHAMDRKCGWTEYMNKHLTFPPKGKFPPAPKLTDECDVWSAIYEAVIEVNPCWDVYQVATTCPVLWDVLGFPGGFDYTPAGASVYFDRADVKKAINAPDVEWKSCADQNVFVTDSGLDKGAEEGRFSSFDVLPSVIDRTKRTVIGHGLLDFVLISNGTLLAIQNMTWGGEQGFQKPIKDDFYVPYHNDSQIATLAASGVMGRTHTERKLTFVEINLSGHMVPQYQPSAAYRHLEFLLGRVPSLTSRQPFTKTNNGLPALGPSPPENKAKAGLNVVFGKEAENLLRTKAKRKNKTPSL